MTTPHLAARILSAVPPEGIALRDLYAGLIEQGEALDRLKSPYRGLRAQGALDSFRQGSGFWVVRGEQYEQVLQSLGDRSATAGSLPPVRVTREHRLPKPLWAQYMMAYHDGRMHVAFVPSDATVLGYKSPGDPHTHKIAEVSTDDSTH